MAYYTALINAWNSPVQPPAGVTGTGLTAQMTTDQKIVAVNGWTIVGAIPTSFYVSGDQLLNCINWSEFAALTPGQQANLLSMCTVSGPHLGGSGNTAYITAGMFLAYFTNLSGPTITNLTALAEATVRVWWGVPVAENGGGLNGPVNVNDCTAAGLS